MSSGDQRSGPIAGLDAASAAVGPSGVDRAQIEGMLDLSPVARLELLEDWLDGIAELREQLSREEGLGVAR